MFIKLLLIFTLVPIADLALLIEIGRQIGLWPTIAIVLITGVAGSALLRWQGLGTIAKFKRELAEGRFPGNTIIEGIAIIVGGAFLLTPGVMTDAVGILLLLPPTRAVFIAIVKRYIKRKFDIDEFITVADEPPPRDEPLDPNLRIEP
ncbi:MAG TPA: FxsA family protein [candidate division Zixibacteria bacterium]|nr:FxsA family protein [candidate division Zixibacteria bacterium]